MSGVQNAAGDEPVHDSPPEYDPNDPETWAVRDDVESWNSETRVYIQAPPEDVPDTDEKFTDVETENLCVEGFDWGEVNVYPEDVDPSSVTQDIRREYEGNSSKVPLWWITELLVTEGYIEDQQYGVRESTPEAAELSMKTVSTDTVAATDEVKEIAEAAYMDAVNEYTSMGTMDKLEKRTARRKFERWWQRNHE